MKDRSSLLIGAAAISLLTLVPWCQKPPSVDAEQLSFSAEDETVRRPVALPEGVRQILKGDEYASSFLKDQDPPAKELPSSWFMASQIHLAGPDEADLIVIGKCPVCGANVSAFWVFRPKAGGFEMILFTGALGFKVRNERTSGYRRIETGAVTMQKAWTTQWRFDGSQYKPSEPVSLDEGAKA